jgi:hypothetical protein
MDEKDPRLNEIDRMYGYEENVEEEPESKSIAQQLVDAIKQRRQRAFHGVKQTI